MFRGGAEPPASAAGNLASNAGLHGCGARFPAEAPQWLEERGYGFPNDGLGGRGQRRHRPALHHLDVVGMDARDILVRKTDCDAKVQGKGLAATQSESSGPLGERPAKDLGAFSAVDSEDNEGPRPDVHPMWGPGVPAGRNDGPAGAGGRQRARGAPGSARARVARSVRVPGASRVWRHTDDTPVLDDGHARLGLWDRLPRYASPGRDVQALLFCTLAKDAAARLHPGGCAAETIADSGWHAGAEHEDRSRRALASARSVARGITRARRLAADAVARSPRPAAHEERDQRERGAHGPMDRPASHRGARYAC